MIARLGSRSHRARPEISLQRTAVVIELRAPYLIFLGGVKNPLDAKTGSGLVDWRPELCAGQLRDPGCAVDLGLPEMSVGEAALAGVGSLVIGVATIGGGLESSWLATLEEALAAGLDIVSGTHARLDGEDRLALAAQRYGRRLIDLRLPPSGIPVGSGRRRSGRRLLTVGTDCCVGKKYTALALHRVLSASRPATFRATGQTGILIAGGGIPIDAVVSDFVSGAAEMLSPDNEPEHWDVIEGQGSLFHPGYAAVTLGLIHGSQPDGMVLCHQPGRWQIDEYPGFAIPPLTECAHAYVEAARLTNPEVRVVGVSLNTAGLSAAARDAALAVAAEATGLPAFDPMLGGFHDVVAALETL
jgi:uncharacterized NAD-dependent epimerase/dehydratase family protein